MPESVKKYWFLVGLFIVVIVTIADTTETISGAGKWFKIHQGPNTVIVLIFFFSGLILDAGQIKSGIKDFEGIMIALLIIFLMAPISAAGFGLSALDTGIKLGLFLVAVMPTTLSSGVVMTGAAGGNMAQALVITITANALAVVTIPFTLSLLLNLIGGKTVVVIDKTAIMLKLGLLVLLPLGLGLIIKYLLHDRNDTRGKTLQIINQCLVLAIVWMAVSQARNAILNGSDQIGAIFILVFIFHGILLTVAFMVTRLFKIGKGRRESVLFMGGQKTLPLSVILQVSLFPQYGLALVVCVMHHLIQLIMDGYLVGKLRE